MSKILLLILLPILSNASDTKYVVDDYNKQGGIQAYKMSLDDKFSIRGGTVSGKAIFSKAPLLKSGIIFQDGTIQNTAATGGGGASSTILQ